MSGRCGSWVSETDHKRRGRFGGNPSSSREKWCIVFLGVLPVSNSEGRNNCCFSEPMAKDELSETEREETSVGVAPASSGRLLGGRLFLSCWLDILLLCIPSRLQLYMNDCEGTDT